MWRRRGSQEFVFVSWLALAAVVPIHGAVANVVDSRVVAVTVFPDRAEVVREARLELSAGTSRWEFARLPWEVEPDSLQVSTTGVPCVTGAVDLRESAHEAMETAELAAAERAVRSVEEEIARLGAGAQVDASLRSFLDAAAVAAVTPPPEGDRASLDPAALQAAYDLMSDRLAQLADRKIARTMQQRDLDEQLQVARARVAAARPRGAIRSRTSSIELQAAKPGTVVVRLSYVTPGASWVPSYRAELTTSSSTLVLSSDAEVRQSTGEDWAGVALVLSTENPARGVQPPTLSTRFLRVSDARARLAYSEGLTLAPGVTEAPPTGTFGQNLNLDAISEIDIITSGSAAEYSQAQGGFANIIVGRSAEPDGWLVEVDGDGNPVGMVAPAGGVAGDVALAALAGTSYHLSFDVPGASDIPSDGTSHRVALRSDTLDVALHHRSAPALSAEAYLLATARSARDYPLLPGVVRVIVDGGYRGRFAVGEVAAAEDLELPFGVDRDIRVERVRLPEERIARREDRVLRAYRTTVRNQRDEPATLVLQERVPVSEDGRIRVEISEGTTPGGAEDADRPGIYEWTLDLAPGEERTVTVGWMVRARSGIAIADVQPS